MTAIELMPVAQFPGERNWGYDGVYPYAVQNSYGGPRGLQRLVDAAHAAGLAVILDVVYNHLGPEGNYLGKFGPYFTDRYHTPWGQAINFDGPDSDPVRQFFIDNACSGCAIFTSTGCGWTPSRRSTISAPATSWPRSRRPCSRRRRRPGGSVHVIARDATRTTCG